MNNIIKLGVQKAFLAVTALFGLHLLFIVMNSARKSPTHSNRSFSLGERIANGRCSVFVKAVVISITSFYVGLMIYLLRRTHLDAYTTSKIHLPKQGDRFEHDGTRQTSLNSNELHLRSQTLLHRNDTALNIQSPDPETTEESYYEDQAQNRDDTPRKHNYYFYYYTGRRGDPPIVVKKSPQKTSLTGAAADCNSSHKTSSPHNYSVPINPNPDSGTVIISCRIVSYRAPLREIESGGVPILVGILSSANGLNRRDSIRSTWARNRKGIYFIVAGPWEQIEQEFLKYRDLIWINENETYEGEESVLPFKTESFISIVHQHSPKGKAGYLYIFKTDDDSYVDMLRLENTLLLGNWREPVDYWGKCTRQQYPPLRDLSLKWAVSLDIYPEDLYPTYCQGAGYALSRKFVKCAVDEGHISRFRYNPFEDVSIGLLAERCGVLPVTDERIIQYRGDAIEHMLASENSQWINLLPKPTMNGGKIVQHRVKTHYDMYEHYLCSIQGC